MAPPRCIYFLCGGCPSPGTTVVTSLFMFLAILNIEEEMRARKINFAFQIPLKGNNAYVQLAMSSFPDFTLRVLLQCMGIALDNTALVYGTFLLVSFSV